MLPKLLRMSLIFQVPDYLLFFASMNYSTTEMVPLVMQ